MTQSHSSSYAEQATQRRTQRRFRFALLNTAIATVTLLSLSLIVARYLRPNGPQAVSSRELPVISIHTLSAPGPGDSSSPYRLTEPVYIVAQLVSVEEASQSDSDGDIPSLPFLSEPALLFLGYLPGVERGDQFLENFPNVSSTRSLEDYEMLLQAHSMRHEIAVYEYEMWGLERRKNASVARRWKGRITFGVVLAITAIGIFLSYREFQRNSRTESILRIGIDGLEVNSAILGVIILTFSVGFFYLYLVQIFPVKEISGSSQQQETLVDEDMSEDTPIDPRKLPETEL